MKNNTMKKLMALLLAVAMVFGFAACGEKPVNPQKPEEPKIPVVDPEDSTAKLKLTLDEWPVIDGATAMLPYYQEMASRVLGITPEEAAKHVLCSTTTQAYQNLAEGKVDMIFCAPPSAEQIEYAKNNGVEFESVQVLNSGFVFFVNKSNPVNSLTSQQIHDIYAGKITNWKEVGGNDEPIIAYQRSEGSGSQTGLYQHVIPKDEVMDAPLEQMIGAMGEIVDAVANYDNGKNALGYSYYYYITNMHYQEDVKLIAIDNIYPTPDTITSDMYPYISKTCAVFNSAQPEDSVVRKIAAWCHGSAGNVMSVELGYVPSGEKYIIPGYGDNIKTREPIGMVKANNLKIKDVIYKPDEYVDRNYCIQIAGLKDEAAEKKINDRIYAVFDEYMSGDLLLTDEFENYDAANFYAYSYAEGNYANILSVELFFSASYYSDSENYYLSKIVPLNFDLRTGEEFKIRDLFKDAENGMAYLNAAVYEEINAGNYMDENIDNWWDYNAFSMAAPFKGIKDDQKFYIGANGTIELIFDEATPEFYLPGTYMTISADGRCIIDFDKFETADSLFTDESESVHLFFNEFENQGREIDLADYLEGIPLEDMNIYPYCRGRIYDDMTEAQKSAAYSHKEDVRRIAKEYLAIARPLQASGFNGGFEIYTYTGKYDRFTNIRETCRADWGYNRDGEYVNDFLEFAACTVFEDGNDTPLSLNGIFKDGVDVKAVLTEAIYKQLVSDIEDNSEFSKDDANFEIADENTLRALAAEAAENIASFGIESDGLTFYYDGADAIVKKYMNGYAHWIYTSALARVAYRNLDCRNLSIFML